jgi:hypothetical protein
LPTQKIVLKEILGFYNVGAKGLFRKLGYAYILSGCRDRICVENIHSFAFFCARRRWTAIGVGAIRYNTARAPLSTAIVHDLTSLLYDAHIFVRAHYSCMFLSCAYSTMIILTTVYIPMKINVNSNVCIIYWVYCLLSP